MLNLKTSALATLVLLGLGSAVHAQTAPDLVMFAVSGEASSSLILQTLDPDSEAEVSAESSMKVLDYTALDPDSINSKVVVETTGEAEASYELTQPELSEYEL